LTTFLQFYTAAFLLNMLFLELFIAFQGQLVKVSAKEREQLRVE